MDRLRQSGRAVFRSPILWGVLGSGVFFGLVHAGPLGTPFITRYFTHHPVEYAETVLFAVGLAVLILRALDVAAQRAGLGQSLLGPAGRAAASIDQRCRGLLESLDRLPPERREHYYPRRLRAALEHIRELSSTQGLGDELKYLAERDATRLQNGYSLFQVIIWAIPILGFLGTVIGITMALNSLDPKALDESMMQVTTGLGVKFDTTALALGMSMLLMFTYFFVHRLESSLLDEVDRRVAHDLAGRFPQVASDADGQLAAVGRMVEALAETTERLVQQQASLWRSSLDAAGNHLKKALDEAIAESMMAHAERLAAAEQAAAEQNRRQWDKVQQGLAEMVQALAAMQAELVRQAEILGRAVDASGEVTRLQEVLNRNLAALAGTKHIEQTISGLAAAVHLLNARLAEVPAASPLVQLDSPGRTAKAA